MNKEMFHAESVSSCQTNVEDTHYKERSIQKDLIQTFWIKLNMIRLGLEKLEEIHPDSFSLKQKQLRDILKEDTRNLIKLLESEYIRRDSA